MYEQPSLLPAHMFYSNALYFGGRYALWQEHNGSMPLVSYLASDSQRQGQVAAAEDIFVQTTTAMKKQILIIILQLKCFIFFCFNKGKSIHFIRLLQF